MERLKEVKRRVRNAMRALAGLEMQPVEIAPSRIVFERRAVRTQGFQVERIIHLLDVSGDHVQFIEAEKKLMAKELGRELLASGAITFEEPRTGPQCGDFVLRAWVEVVMATKMEEVKR